MDGAPTLTEAGAACGIGTLTKLRPLALLAFLTAPGLEGLDE